MNGRLLAACCVLRAPRSASRVPPVIPPWAGCVTVRTDFLSQQGDGAHPLIIPGDSILFSYYKSARLHSVHREVDNSRR